MDSSAPPRLPPRKPSGWPTDGQILVDSPKGAETPLPSTARSTSASPLPPLPPRKSTQLPPPIAINPNIAPGGPVPGLAKPVSAFEMSVTPATPESPIKAQRPVTASVDEKSYAAEQQRPVAVVDVNKKETGGTESFMPTGSYESALTEQLKGAIPHVPVQEISKQVGIPVEWILVSTSLILLAYFQFSLLWILSLGLFATAWLSKTPGVDDVADRGDLGGPGLSDTKQQREAVTWVNHALYALFPLISTDVLTPFIDLLEDALAQQVPPMVTSVRMTAAALGSQPMLLTSLRHMSDQEWAASLSKKPKPSETAKSQGHRRNQSTGSNLPTPSNSGRPRSSSAASSSPSLRRSVSASSTGSAIDSEGMAELTSKMRKRDRVLRRMPRRRRTRDGAADTRDPGDAQTREGRDRTAEAMMEDGTTAIGGEGGEVEEDDPNAGQYVNYQVGFEYQQPKKAKERRGWGLHVLAFFGVGVKGVGATEMPVYIDMIRIKGTINLRLLLSATPPFVRSATFSFPRLPVFEISAKPLIKSAFNAMELPGMRSYVQSSIAEVAQGFVSPASYSIDVDRLLLGRESSLRTHSVGVLQIMIHGAEDLPKTDTMGSCDPYVAISFSKFNKPMFSTRTILRNRDPWWEEEAFILVSADAIEAGERLRLRVCDSDRFSADDAMGVVEVELADLVERGKESSSEELDRRVDEIQAEQPGMRTSGYLHWSVKFHSLWEMAPEEIQERMLQRTRERKGEPEKVETPWWIEQMKRWAGEIPTWAEERQKRRQETVAWFTGEKEKDEMEASEAPSPELRSGVLQFHLHQCVDLEVESLAGTYSSKLDGRKSAANGKPALADIVDRTPAENPEPPSAYCEVHINDRLIYRTRTKQMTPLPYFNAVSERFIRDWRLAKLTIVVRDERDREHDPILGIVVLQLKDAFKDTSQFTRWYPLVGGLGWGRLRLSLLWKPFDMVLPPHISGYEVATLQIKSITSTDLGKLSDRPISVIIETEADKYTLNPGDSTAVDPSRSSGTVNEISSPVRRRTPSGQGVPKSPSGRSLGFNDSDDTAELEWEINNPIRLAVEYRHSCSVLISFVARKRLQKKKTIGLALIRLSDCEDVTEVQRTVPIFGTTDPGDAVRATQRYAKLSNHDASCAKNETRHVRARPSLSSQRSSGAEIPLLGFVSLTFNLQPGVSRAHKKLCKKDLRFKRVYESWEVAQDIELGLDKVVPGGTVKTAKDLLKSRAQDGDGDEDGSGSDSGHSDDDEDEADDGLDEGIDDDLSNPETRKFKAERRDHSKALHRRNKGIFQLKIARTGKFVKDKLAAKMYAGASGAGGKLDKRPRGADMDVEYEGTSKI